MASPSRWPGKTYSAKRSRKGNEAAVTGEGDSGFPLIGYVPSQRIPCDRPRIEVSALTR